VRTLVFRFFLLLWLVLLSPLGWAGKQTVCTVTINSADEQKTFRRYLPADKYDFVELVEHGRRDWLQSSCQQKVSCDILIISGHHGEGSEGNVFFSEANDVREYLPIEELERVSCSSSCPSLFAHLKEVYLFGCNTLNPDPQHTVSDEVVRSFMRDGHSQAEASELAKKLAQLRGESGRDRMRLLFPNVPVIYGFSSVAPLGPFAASKLDRYFRSFGTSEVGKGRASSHLLSQFSANHMVATRGMSTGDPLAGTRGEVCMFADDRMSDAQRLDDIHQLLTRPAPEARMMLDRIEHFTATLDASKREQPDVSQALQSIAADSAARDRFMVFARDADELDTRARMFKVAHDLGWLSDQQQRDEIVAMIGQLLSRRKIAAVDVNFACTLNEKHDLDGELDRLTAAAGADDSAHAAVLACMGSDKARARVLDALVSPSDADVQIAQAYLRQRPVADAAELRSLTREIAQMSASDAQARALDVLAHHYLSDRETVATLKTLYANTRSWPVQNAIAGVLIRADRSSIADPDLLPTLREHRLKSVPGDDMVSALIARLRESS
jgi:hypothetical protein